MKIKRVFLMVLDSFGIGGAIDALEYGDLGADTLKTVSKSPKFKMENMRDMGLFNIDGVDVYPDTGDPKAAYARLLERSRGKDTTTGHWEIAGVISKRAFPVYPEGFPKEIIEEFREKTKRGVLCNKPYSGTDVIRDFGKEHIKTGKLIVYTSADSVFQIAAHEDVVNVQELYEYCRIARDILSGEHAVARVIARPFAGDYPDFYRTSGRHDFSLTPPKTVLDIMKESGLSVIGVGKIFDIFAGKGITEHVYTKDNKEGIERTLEFLDKDFTGLCFVNLVDFDMKYGHRNDTEGYAEALSYFDKRLPEITEKLKDNDILIITADHGCDPGFPGTDHTREDVPLLVFGKAIKPINLGKLDGFSAIGKTILDIFSLEGDISGESFLENILTR